MDGFVMEKSAPKPEICLLYFGDYWLWPYACDVSCVK